MAAVFAVFGQNIPVPVMFLTGIVILLLISALVSRRRNRKLNAFMSSIPGPIPLPFIGTVYVFIGLGAHNTCEFFLKHAKQYPKFSGHWFAGEAALITGDLEITNAVLASRHNVEKGTEYKVFKNGCAGIFTASGHEWRSARKALTPGFKTNIQGASFAENYRRHLPTLLETLGKYADDGKEHDLFSDIHLCLMDFICCNLFDAGTDIQKQQHYLSRISIIAIEMAYDRLFNPPLWLDSLYVLLGLKKKFDKTISGGRAFVTEILNERIKIRDELKKTNPTTERPQTFMEVLLSSVDAGIISKEDAVEELLELGVAGTLTSAVILAGNLWLLSMFPDIQKKAYEEIIATCTGDEVTLDDLPKLVYVEMICKEALRHFSTTFFARHLVQDLKVNEKMTIPAGVHLVLSPWLLHHNPAFWEKPGEFYPEHFSEANESERPKGAYIPFLSGPRSCPGNKYAMQSMKMLVANILLHFELSSNSEPPRDLREIKCQILFMLLPPKGCVCQIKRRQNKKTDTCSR